MKVYEAYARAFRAEGVETVFGLMGDGNMLWMTEMVALGSDLIQGRHEAAVVAMADGFARKTGKVGVATVTCGPGLTHATTSLVLAAKQGTPLVVFAGDSPLRAPFYLQEIDQSAVVSTTGAIFVSATNADNAADDVRRAFHLARTERRPVVFNAPLDLQDDRYDWPWTYQTSEAMVRQRIEPDPDAVERLAELISNSRRPIIVAGRGAVAASAGAAIESLAEKSGALLSTSLLAKGLFDHHPRNIGLAGAFSDAVARKAFAESDLVIAVGARLGHFTSEGGYLFPEARVVTIDTNPQLYKEGLWAFEFGVQGDAKTTAEAVTKALTGRAYDAHEVGEGYWAAGGQASAGSLPPEPTDVLDWTAEVEGERAADAYKVCEVIDRSVPLDWSIVMGIGHFWNFAVPTLRNRKPDRYTFNCEFGTIGQGLPCAIGVASSRAALDSPTVLIEGDGSLLQNLQELETIARSPVPLLILVFNDGAYGAEIHKLRSKGRSDDLRSLAIFGRPDFAGVASALGLIGVTARDATTLRNTITNFARNPVPTVVDIPITREVSGGYRRIHFGEETD